MVEAQNQMVMSPYSEIYDLVIPPDHRLRRINDLIYFSFVYQELASKYCPDNGRTAIDPIRMFKYLLLKVMDTLSDIDVPGWGTRAQTALSSVTRPIWPRPRDSNWYPG